MGFFANIFKKQEKLEPFDIGRLKVDIHSHLIPGIDDGAQDMDQAIAMLAKFERLGFKKVVTTPHVMTDSFPNTNEIILDGLEALRNEAKKSGLKIEIDAAAEYYFDETLMPKIANKELLTFGDNYVLVEFAFHSKPQFQERPSYQLPQLLFHLLKKETEPLSGPLTDPSYTAPICREHLHGQSRWVYPRVSLTPLMQNFVNFSIFGKVGFLILRSLGLGMVVGIRN